MIFGGPSISRQRFRVLAGGDVRGIIFPRLTAGSAAVGRPATNPYAIDATTLEADRDAVHDESTILVGDAVRILVDSIRQAGLNRVLIRDALTELSPWDGHAGTVRWDGLGRNTREVELDSLSP